MTGGARRVALWLATLALGATTATAQAPDAAALAAARQLGARVAQAGDGIVRFSYAAQPGVCGDGENVVRRGGGSATWNGQRVSEWERDCEPGPVRLSLTVRGGQVTELRSYVGGRWRAAEGAPIADLGTVSAPGAAAYLLQLAATLPAEPAKKAILPASLADSAVTWPALLRLARDASRPEAVRRDAVFWVGQAAGEAATRGLSDLVDQQDADLRVREQAVFALSQRPAGDGVPVLLQIARTSPSPRLRKRAIFWLGQSKDPRALAYFEAVLAEP